MVSLPCFLQSEYRWSARPADEADCCACDDMSCPDAVGVNGAHLMTEHCSTSAAIACRTCRRQRPRSFASCISLGTAMDGGHVAVCNGELSVTPNVVGAERNVTDPRRRAAGERCTAHAFSCLADCSESAETCAHRRTWFVMWSGSRPFRPIQASAQCG